MQNASAATLMWFATHVGIDRWATGAQESRSNHERLADFIYFGAFAEEAQAECHSKQHNSRNVRCGGWQSDR